MARIANVTTQIASSDVIMTTNTMVLAGNQEVDTREALSGVVHVKFKLSTAAAGNTFKIYALYSNDDNIWDDLNNTLNRELVTIAMPNDTADHYITVPLDGVTVGANYMRLAVYCSAASNYGVLRDLKMAIRKAV